MSDAELNSPPRPRRQILPIIPSTVTHSSIRYHQGGYTEDVAGLSQFEGGIVDKAVSDLPNIATQVLSLNKDQNNEIQKQQKQLAFLQEMVKEGEEKVADVELEISCVMNKIFMLEESNKETNKRMRALDSEIRQKVTEVSDGELEVNRACEMADLELRKLQKHLAKIDQYSNATEQFQQSSSEIYGKLLTARSEVEELKKQSIAIDADPEEKDRILSGIVEKELLSEIDDLKSKLLEAGNETKNTIAKLTEERQKQKQLKQTVQVLQNRNIAQMTRLKRQVKDTQQRNRQKNSQLAQLRHNVDQAEQQLKEHYQH